MLHKMVLISSENKMCGLREEHLVVKICRLNMEYSEHQLV